MMCTYIKVMLLMVLHWTQHSTQRSDKRSCALDMLHTTWYNWMMVPVKQQLMQHLACHAGSENHILNT